MVYRYGDRQDQSWSTNPSEILPLIYGLAGVTPPATAGRQPEGQGYPLVADTFIPSLWFYLALPALTALAWWQSRRPRTPPEVAHGGVS